jgi:hypothetical protein
VKKGSGGNSEISKPAALEVLRFFSNGSSNVQFLPERDQLIVRGLSFRESLLITACLVALGASQDNFIPSGPDGEVVLLGKAHSIAQEMARHGIDFVGRASLPSLDFHRTPFA